MHSMEKSIYCEVDNCFICYKCKTFGDHKDHRVKEAEQIRADGEKYKQLRESIERSKLSTHNLEKEKKEIIDRINAKRNSLVAKIEEECDEFLTEVKAVKDQHVEEIQNIFQLLLLQVDVYIQDKRELYIKQQQVETKLKG